MSKIPCMNAIQETARDTRDVAAAVHALATVLCATAVLLGALRLGPSVPRLARVARSRVYCAAREWEMGRTLARVGSWRVVRHGRVTVHFTSVDEGISTRVAGYASTVFESIADQVAAGDAGGGFPREIHVVLFPSFASMADMIPGAGEARSVGVYWAGVVGVVSPGAWGDMFGEGEPFDLFLRYNPLNHEMTHLWLDYAAAGNYPYWFSEGLAQVVEYGATGYVWPGGTADLGGAIAEDDVERAFRSEETLGEAYRGAMALSREILEGLGRDGAARLAALLRSGYSFNQAVGRAAATQDRAASLLKQGGQR